MRKLGRPPAETPESLQKKSVAVFAQVEGEIKLPGLKEARVVHPRSQALLHPGPRLVEGLDELEAALRPARPDGG